MLRAPNSKSRLDFCPYSYLVMPDDFSARAATVPTLRAVYAQGLQRFLPQRRAVYDALPSRSAHLTRSAQLRRRPGQRLAGSSANWRPPGIHSSSASGWLWRRSDGWEDGHRHWRGSWHR